jgi:hypothetical protein
MPRTGWSPTTIPYGADQTVYLVIDRFSSGSGTTAWVARFWKTLQIV